MKFALSWSRYLAFVLFFIEFGENDFVLKVKPHRCKRGFLCGALKKNRRDINGNAVVDWLVRSKWTSECVELTELPNGTLQKWNEMTNEIKRKNETMKSSAKHRKETKKAMKNSISSHRSRQLLLKLLGYFTESQSNTSLLDRNQSLLGWCVHFYLVLRRFTGFQWNNEPSLVKGKKVIELSLESVKSILCEDETSRW